MTTDLVVFLRDRLNQAEELARKVAVDGADWDFRASPLTVVRGNQMCNIALAAVPHTAEARFLPEFIASNDPASVLRRVAADRKTLERHQSDQWGKCTRCCDATVPYELPTLEDWPCPELRNLAEGYGWTGETA